MELAAPPQGAYSTSVASIFESDSKHVMNLGEAVCSPVSVDLDGKASSRKEQSHKKDEHFDEASCPDVDPSQYTPTSADREFRRTDSGQKITLCAVGRSITEEPEMTNLTKGFISNDVVHSLEGDVVDRGRTLAKGPRFNNPLARAESRLRRNDPAIEVDIRPIEKRLSRSSTFFENPSDPCAVFEDNLLEPCPHLPTCRNLSEILNSVGGWPCTIADFSSGYASKAITSRPPTGTLSRTHTTPVINPCRPRYYAPTLILDTPPLTLPDVNHHHCVATATLPLSCKTGQCQALAAYQTNFPEPPSSLATTLPTEIIHQIFYNLHPQDFNSSRHICRSWFISSLERSVLETMLKRGGWSDSIQSHIAANHVRHSRMNVNEEWLMSKRISQECALGSGWTGNGLADKEEEGNIHSAKSAFVYSCTIDFTDIATHNPHIHSAGTIFTVSNCGRFLMAANGCLIYIYQLNRSHETLDDSSADQLGSLRSVTRILCPQKVIACSMDTSSHRYAIAVLLDGRMGLVCDINPSNITPPAPPSSNRTSNSKNGKHSDWSSSSKNICEMEGDCYRATPFLDHVSLNSSSSNLGSCCASSEPPFVFPGIATTGTQCGSNTEKSAWQGVHQGEPRECVLSGPSYSRHLSSPWASTLSPEERLNSILPQQQQRKAGIKSMPIETGPRSLYRNLCSDEDPPRSVSICPQRRCVAFGCSAGIELHWVDALTGQDLSRWFPLTAPSDYLFFLPPRKCVDSAKKLRLISSAARPGVKTAVSERSFGGRRRKNGLFWERPGWRAGLMDDEEVAIHNQGMVSRLRSDAGCGGLNARMNHSDHYHAVPLSDGYHILFTDPTTGLLCLGSDAPVGGPTKLSRKIWFEGPAGKGSPVAYASGSDLSSGVRVIAAFGNGSEQSIWLFSVPSDVFAASQDSQTTARGAWLNAKSSIQSRNVEWMNWWPDDGLKEWLSHAQDPVQGILPRSNWPVKISGQEIGRISRLADLAIDSGPGMIIWGFSAEGLAKVWRINDGKHNGAKKRCVARDGTIRVIDHEGDWEMSDAPSSSKGILEPILASQQDSFDGTASFTIPSVFATELERFRHLEWSQCTVHYDSDGDVLMEDLPKTEVLEREWTQDSLNVADLTPSGEMAYETCRRSYRTCFGHESDLVEELTGISRIDIEIS